MQNAVLFVSENQSCPVVVKSMGDTDPESLRLFLVETATMVQFNHPNIQMIHGTMFRSSEIMVCLESASHGPLDAMMREYQKPFPLIDIVHTLRGVACGMQYLSELGYVHKVRRPHSFLIFPSFSFISSTVS